MHYTHTHNKTNRHKTPPTTMNTPPPLLLLTLLIFTTLSSATSPPPPVLDIAKKPLSSGTNYHILPVFRGLGGGLTLAPTRNNQTCPLDVVQERQEVRPGLPVTFSPVNAKKGGDVPLSTDLNIKFSAASICGQSTVWRLENRGGGGFVVSSGGVEGKAGRETVNNWFKIEKEKEDYKIVFCPTVCSTCRPVCGDIGVEIVNGRRRLGLSDAPLMVMFRRA